MAWSSGSWHSLVMAGRVSLDCALGFVRLLLHVVEPVVASVRAALDRVRR